jgi:hypothetical protein
MDMGTDMDTYKDITDMDKDMDMDMDTDKDMNMDSDIHMESEHRPGFALRTIAQILVMGDGALVRGISSCAMGTA